MKLVNHWARFFILGMIIFWVVPVGAQQNTPFEKSGGKNTPRYAETIAWCTDLAAGSDLLKMESFGTSPQGRDLPVIIANLDSHEDKLVVLVQACIHAGESCGKDAGMLLLRDLVEDDQFAAELLANITLLFVPIFNVDGHERFGPYNRVNQNGPAAMGWRATAKNLNLNRDFLKADTSEMRSWLGLFQKWQPDFLIDVHSTDGANYQYAVTYGLETGGNMDEGLTRWTNAYNVEIDEAMALVGYPIAPYVSYVEWHDPRSGLERWVAGPRYSQGYMAIQNRPGLLIETHTLKDYPTRVDSARQLIIKTLRWLNGSGANLGELNTAADRFAASEEFRSKPFALTFERTKKSRPLTFLGVVYETMDSAVTGGQWNKFSSIPDTFVVDYYEESLPAETVNLPEAYLIPPEWEQVIERLDLHGISYRRLGESTEVQVQTYRFKEAKWAARPYEGHHPVTFEQEPFEESRVFPRGSVVVDMNQRSARVIAHLLEPQGPDSMVRWGFFDPVFERVEYIESYVLEAMIPRMLADDPRLVQELAQRKVMDPEFANDPWAIREWFYEKTPYYDQRVGIYPVGTVDDRTLLDQFKYSK